MFSQTWRGMSWQRRALVVNIQGVENEKSIAVGSTGVLFLRRETQHNAVAEQVQAVCLITPADWSSLLGKSQQIQGWIKRLPAIVIVPDKQRLLPVWGWLINARLVKLKSRHSPRGKFGPWGHAMLWLTTLMFWGQPGVRRQFGPLAFMTSALRLLLAQLHGRHN